MTLVSHQSEVLDIVGNVGHPFVGEPVFGIETGHDVLSSFSVKGLTDIAVKAYTDHPGLSGIWRYYVISRGADRMYATPYPALIPTFVNGGFLDETEIVGGFFQSESAYILNVSLEENPGGSPCGDSGGIYTGADLDVEAEFQNFPNSTITISAGAVGVIDPDNVGDRITKLTIRSTSGTGYAAALVYAFQKASLATGLPIG